VDWHDLTGQLLYSVQQMGKAQFLRDLSRNTVRGHLAGAAKGEWQGGTAPYGYQLVPIPDAPPRKNGTYPRRLVVDPETAAVVRRISRLILDGNTLHDVADILNQDGIPSPGGCKWRESTLSSMVRKRLYLGEFRYGDDPEGKYFRATADGVQPGRKGPNGVEHKHVPFTLPNNHEALVTVADFERVQAVLAERKLFKTPLRRHENPYALTGLLRCAHCGGPLVGVRRRGKGVSTSPMSAGTTSRAETPCARTTSSESGY
jgi:site-specific DNA recombinase